MRKQLLANSYQLTVNFLLLRLGLLLAVSCQLLTVKAQSFQFQADTVAVGAEVRATAIFTYPVGSILILPDSATGFKPFERVRFERLKRDTQRLEQRDSVFFVLRTFSLDSIQYLSLPYQYIDNGDTVAARTSVDSILLARRVTDRFDRELVPNLALAHIEKPFPIALVLTLAAIVVFGGAMGYVFGRAPYRRWRQRVALDRRYKRLQADLAALTPLRDQDTLTYLNRLNAAWRTFLQDEFPTQLPSLTPTELATLLRSQSAIPEADSAILVQLSRWEEALNYARQPVPAAALAQYQQQLDRLLAATYQRRREGIV